ncbi:MAG: hypothetical protein V8S01_02300 [Dorea sp.]
MNWGSVGMNIVKGIASGLTNAAKSLANAAANAASNALDWVKLKAWYSLAVTSIP